MKGGAALTATIYIHSGFSLKSKIGQLVKLGFWAKGPTSHREPNHRNHLHSVFMAFYGNIPVSVDSFYTMIFFFVLCIELLWGIP